MMNVRNGTAVAVLLLLPVTAAAQATPSPPDTTQPSTPTGQQQTTPANSYKDQTGHWLASGFVGSNFANNANPASMDFGGSVGYLMKDRYGVEFDAGFTPDFQLQSNFLGLGIKPDVNSYMGNFVYAVPLGSDRQWQPYVTAGAGAISLRSGMNSSNGNAIDNTLNPDDTRFGGNFGGGVMGFRGNWGFKANVQYFRASGSYNTSYTGTTTTGGPAPMPGPTGGYVTTTGASSASTAGVNGQIAPAPVNQTPNGLASAALSGLHFWRANVGVAIRW